MFCYFRDVALDQTFTYDGDTFVKHRENAAWELRGGERYKEWAFNHDDRVRAA